MIKKRKFTVPEREGMADFNIKSYEYHYDIVYSCQSIHPKMKFYGFIAAFAALLVIHIEASPMDHSAQMMLKFINETLTTTREYFTELITESSKTIMDVYGVRRTNAQVYSVFNRDQLSGLIQEKLREGKDVTNCTGAFESKVSELLNQHFDELTQCRESHMANYSEVVTREEIWQAEGVNYQSQIRSHIECYDKDFGAECDLDHSTTLNDAILAWKVEGEKMKRNGDLWISYNNIRSLNCLTLSGIYYRRNYYIAMKNEQRCLGVGVSDEQLDPSKLPLSVRESKTSVSEELPKIATTIQESSKQINNEINNVV
ncbi:uncharacterized protein LOC135161592 [Diachasmimorpha longicaudata]|uniref:uncharacterized protein LOC135161592 n=1 Tax=Diachasmimorpha longicaudata TaxID=58733 RepID=UPI0030B8AC9B